MGVLGFLGGVSKAASESQAQGAENRLRMMQLAQQLGDDQLRRAMLQQQLKMAPLETQLEQAEIKSKQQAISAKDVLLNDPTLSPSDRALATIAPESYAAMMVERRLKTQAADASSKAFTAMAQDEPDARKRNAWLQAAAMAKNMAPETAINAVLKGGGVNTDDALEAYRAANTAMLLMQAKLFKSVTGGMGATPSAVSAPVDSSADSLSDSLAGKYGIK
jgi:hypothetical protein